jgi:hypothetical protein
MDCARRRRAVRQRKRAKCKLSVAAGSMAAGRTLCQAFALTAARPHTTSVVDGIGHYDSVVFEVDDFRRRQQANPLKFDHVGKTMQSRTIIAFIHRER